MIPTDAEYCPSCGESLDEDDSHFWGDELLNIYRIPFGCKACGYRGEIIRHDTDDGQKSRPTRLITPDKRELSKRRSGNLGGKDE